MTEYELGVEERAIVETVRDFVDRQVRPVVRELEHADTYPEDLIDQMKRLGIFGLAIGRPYGEAEVSTSCYALVTEELARGWMSLAGAMGGHTVVAKLIQSYATDEQKDRYLAAMATGQIRATMALTEPGGGSDLQAIRTTARGDGEDYVVTGQKTWTTLAQHADWIFVLVRTDPDAPKKQQGISFLLIDMATPGVSVRPIELIDGGHEVNEVFFDQVRVPAANLVGQENRGWDYAKFLLGNERVGVAPTGQTKALLARAKSYAADSLADGTTLLDDPLVATRIAALENDLLALELTQLRVVANSEEGKPHPASSVMKLRGTELQQEVTELVVDLAGPQSVASFAGDDSELPEWVKVATPTYLNYRKASIYGGSNEVQRTIIATSILGL